MSVRINIHMHVQTVQIKHFMHVVECVCISYIYIYVHRISINIDRYACIHRCSKTYAHRRHAHTYRQTSTFMSIYSRQLHVMSA